MTGPKHLWSGDWERESASAEDDLAQLAPPAPSHPLPAGPTNRQRWRPNARSLAAGIAILIVAIVAVALATTLGGSSKPRSVQTTAQATVPFGITPPNGIVPNQTIPSPTLPTPTVPAQTPPVQPAPSPISNQPIVEWLGMQIVNSPEGEVINTVGLGSAGDADGFEPGDLIDSINGQSISTAKQIRAAVENVGLGKQVTIEISRGSTIINTRVTLTARPTIQP